MEPIVITYKNSRIEFDQINEEWVSYLNTDTSDIDDEFARNSSLKKLKDSIDRFNSKTFKPMPIYFFDANGRINYADIISFTTQENICWIKHSSGYKSGKKEKISVNSLAKIYSCENIMNESKLIELNELNDEIEKKKDELQTLKRDRYHLISQLQNFDISGYVVSAE